jgi:CRISPR-associated protein Cas5a/b/c
VIGFIVDIEFDWGFQANVIGLSKTSPSFYYPPPTTFLGALAETIAKEQKRGEKNGRMITQELSRNLLAIGVKPLNCLPVKYEDINRIIAVKITSGRLYPNPADLSGSFDAPARAKTILVSLDGEAPRLRWFLVFKDSKIVSANQLWKIHRLGSKESRVSVVETKEITDAEIEAIEGTSQTTYSFPVREVTIEKLETPKNWLSEVYINPFDFTDQPLKDYLEGKKLAIFKIPVIYFKGEEYFCRFEGKAYRYKEEVVVGRSK